MTHPSVESAQRLVEARQTGAEGEIAGALVAHANDLVRSGRIGEARAELDEAAAIHHRAGRRHDEARCTQLAATLCRLDGHLAEAKTRCRRVLTLCASTGPGAVSAFAELGETALAEGNATDAVEAYGAALDAAGATDASGIDRAALLRRRAVGFTALARYQDAVHDLKTAHGLLTHAGDRQGAVRALIEAATALRHADRAPEAVRVVEQAMGLATQEVDHAALADLHLLLAADALDRRDSVAAMSSAQTAREAALAANAPTSYIGAAHTIAQLADSAGDRQAAYAALATGWATLADLLGGDVARMSFAPKLGELRARWGPTAFDDVKRAYEARCRPDGPHGTGSGAIS
jgi:tetratricopeptide (TPR) repeat protein